MDKPKEYVEILGDTVSPQHTIFSIIISTILGLGGFLIGKQVFPLIAGKSMINSYSLLLGILGCVIGLILNAFIFRPIRILTENNTAIQNAEELIQVLQIDPKEEYDIIMKDPVIRKEMEELGIKNLFMPKDGELKK
jgi:uncharacterized membrane protein YeaQ/YmgE (transglycosylase-associated protein family)